jgi:hypothetical protein
MGRMATREVVGLVTVSTVLFLVLTHSTGAARTLNSLGSNFVKSVKVLQGR